MKPIERLMIIDDDELQNYITGKIIDHGEVAEEVYTYYSAAIAFTHITYSCLSGQLKSPMTILLDVSMQGMSGWEFLDCLEELDRDCYKNLDVFILTNSIVEYESEKAKKYRCVKGFFEKPLSRDMILQILSCRSRQDEIPFMSFSMLL